MRRNLSVARTFVKRMAGGSDLALITAKVGRTDHSELVKVLAKRECLKLAKTQLGATRGFVNPFVRG